MKFSLNKNHLRSDENYYFDKDTCCNLDEDKFIKFGKNTEIMSNSIIYYGNTFGKNCFIGHNSLIRQSNFIDDNVKIGSFTEIAFNCKIKKNTKIHSMCFICENTQIGKNVFIGPNVTFTNSKFPNKVESKVNLRSPIIFDNAVIGAGSTIMPGVSIGENALIGAGSLVLRDILSNEIYFNKRNI